MGQKVYWPEMLGKEFPVRGYSKAGQLLEHFGAKVYRTVIPRNVRLAEAPSHGLPALIYDKTSSGALAYLALAGEMLRRESASLA